METQAERAGLPLSAFVGRAAERQLQRARSAAKAREVPAFAMGPHAGDELDVEVVLDAESWSALERAAQERQLAVEQLLVHAALSLAAELDAEDPAIILADLDAEAGGA